MSTMDRAASEPEASRGTRPHLTGAGAARRSAGDEVVALLARVLDAHDVERARVHPAVVADAHGPPAATQHGVAARGHEQPLRADGELARCACSARPARCGR
jgi:hypothetical protein